MKASQFLFRLHQIQGTLPYKWLPGSKRNPKFNMALFLYGITLKLLTFILLFKEIKRSIIVSDLRQDYVNIIVIALVYKVTLILGPFLLIFSQHKLVVLIFDLHKQTKNSKVFNFLRIKDGAKILFASCLFLLQGLFVFFDNLITENSIRKELDDDLAMANMVVGLEFYGFPVAFWTFSKCLTAIIRDKTTSLLTANSSEFNIAILANEVCNQFQFSTNVKLFTFK